MAPVVNGVTPNQGSTAGGTSVSITGSAFVSVTAVRFGGNAASGVVVGSSTQLTAITPAGTGTVNVTVSALSGTSSQTVPYTYVAVPAPVISALAPDQGPVAGGTVVVITGTGFTGATSVRFGSVT
ncbi:IPT/TIG domain-containing protein, partial [Planotetraspora silvatica]